MNRLKYYFILYYPQRYAILHLVMFDLLVAKTEFHRENGVAFADKYKKQQNYSRECNAPQELS